MSSSMVFLGAASFCLGLDAFSSLVDLGLGSTSIGFPCMTTLLKMDFSSYLMALLKVIPSDGCCFDFGTWKVGACSDDDD